MPLDWTVSEELSLEQSLKETTLSFAHDRQEGVGCLF